PPACASMVVNGVPQVQYRAGLVLGAAAVVLAAAFPTRSCADPAKPDAARYHEKIEPILEQYCYSCHGYGEHKGNHAFDEYKTDQELIGDVKLWLAVLKNVRSGIMPPPDEARPTEEERRLLVDWIERDVFHTDPADPDPGRATLRRLNRVEYRNTIRDLTGVDYDTPSQFPPDDSGYGFDDIGDAMSVSPLLAEKYLDAARAVVGKAVPDSPPDEKDHDAVAAYKRIFSHGPPPKDPEQRDAYSRAILRDFARRAYRRPPDDRTVDRLLELTKAASTPDQTFESEIGTAIVAVLASPRFLFRVEEPSPQDVNQSHPLVDEFTLASRLSYFLWSTTPDEELLSAAEHGELRKNLALQVDRMLKDPRSYALAEDFAGQWLRARDVAHVDIDPVSALGMQHELEDLRAEYFRLHHEHDLPRKDDKADAKDKPAEAHELNWEEREKLRERYRKIKTIGAMFDDKLRRAMRDETEQYFNYVVRDNRDVLELVDSNYTFLNETLAKHYGIDGVHGDEMRHVELPADSPRGGVLTQATILAVTSNPSRTSPVKRGLFVLDNILGFPPPPPPPPNVPLLETAETGIQGRAPTVRELQERHRHEPLCAACHARMDPLGLALENFNALGMWRTTESDQPIDASGKLLSGEEFNGIRDLKTIIKEQHRLDFYHCLTEKLLTYALGRGLEYYDEYTVDQIVARLDSEHGKFSALLMGVIESAPFQKQRRAASVAAK
ncbi:MAG TPA: DUF1592 domain-containing protein, partial [Lacipirellulaceae bacterium]|nr:DUF1592 domain-containing protein [Lacipirellulaceae bacterium]